MPANAVVRARIDEKTKKRATKALKAIGLTPSAAVRILLTRVASDKNPPYDLLVPNAETIAAIEEARKGKLKSFHSIEELMADLNADD